MFRKILNCYNTNGALDCCRRVLAHFGIERIDRSLFFLRIDLSSFISDQRLPYEVAFPSLTDIERTPHYSDGWFSREEAFARLKRGARLAVLRENQGDVCFQWIEGCDARIDWLQMRCRIPDDTIYITGVYTVREFRNRGIGGRFVGEMLHMLKLSGYCHVFVVISPNNESSLRMFKKLGFREYQTIRYQRHWIVKEYCVERWGGHDKVQFKTFGSPPDTLWRRFFDAPVVKM